MGNARDEQKRSRNLRDRSRNEKQKAVLLQEVARMRNDASHRLQAETGRLMEKSKQVCEQVKGHRATAVTPPNTPPENLPKG